jgi:protein-disulfide isomerase
MIRVFIVAMLAVLSVTVSAADDAPTLGPADARVQIVLFADVASPEAGEAFAVVDAFMRAKPAQVSLTFRHHPRSDDEVALTAHRLAIAAANQNRFWDVLRLMFANQDRLALGDLLLMARQAGVSDESRLVTETHEAAADEVLARDRAEAARIRVTSGVTVLVNGRAIAGRVTRGALRAAVASAERH